MLGWDNLKPWIWVVAELVSPPALLYHIYMLNSPILLWLAHKVWHRAWYKASSPECCSHWRVGLALHIPLTYSCSQVAAQTRYAFGGIKATDNGIDICCFITLTGSMGGDFTMALGDSAGYSYQNITLHSFISSSSSLHNAQTILFLFLSHLSTPRLHIVMAPASGRPCSRLTWVSSACLFHMTCFFFFFERI